MGQLDLCRGHTDALAQAYSELEQRINRSTLRVYELVTEAREFHLVMESMQLGVSTMAQHAEQQYVKDRKEWAQCMEQLEAVKQTVLDGVSSTHTPESPSVSIA
eukprot:TRINITY_DN4073_c0_g1_i1.p2 TRINITY_DN4073_c0_g1~~TRINITY_DN4073_c0_g1_i1.p2  ORF type:complete len:104 (+),score=24.75 TRINITY_DN4073_c0_g1_i1:171-482(+)